MPPPARRSRALSSRAGLVFTFGLRAARVEARLLRSTSPNFFAPSGEKRGRCERLRAARGPRLRARRIGSLMRLMP